MHIFPLVQSYFFRPCRFHGHWVSSYWSLSQLTWLNALPLLELSKMAVMGYGWNRSLSEGLKWKEERSLAYHVPSEKYTWVSSIMSPRETKTFSEGENKTIMNSGAGNKRWELNQWEQLFQRRSFRHWGQHITTFHRVPSNHFDFLLPAFCLRKLAREPPVLVEVSGFLFLCVCAFVFLYLFLFVVLFTKTFNFIVTCLLWKNFCLSLFVLGEGEWGTVCLEGYLLFGWP